MELYYICIYAHSKVNHLTQRTLPWGWGGGGDLAGSRFHLPVIVGGSHPRRGPPVSADEALVSMLNMLLLCVFLRAAVLLYLLQVRSTLLALQDVRQDQAGLLPGGWKAEADRPLDS